MGGICLEAMHQRLDDHVTYRHITSILDIGQRFQSRLPVESLQLVQNQRCDAARRRARRCRRNARGVGNIIDMNRLRGVVGQH